MEIKGRNILNGLPENVTVNSAEIRDALVEPLARVIDAIKATHDHRRRDSEYAGKNTA